MDFLFRSVALIPFSGTPNKRDKTHGSHCRAHSGFTCDWGHSRLAAQHPLGLLPEWGDWFVAACSCHFSRPATPLKECNMTCRHTKNIAQCLIVSAFISSVAAYGHNPDDYALSGASGGAGAALLKSSLHQDVIGAGANPVASDQHINLAK